MTVTRSIRPGDPEWPPLLSEMGSLVPPERLFLRGRALDPSSPKIAIVGTRRPTVAGTEIAEHLARGLTQGGFTVVSGLAVGIDAAAHRGALRAGGSTIAVLGCGCDVGYPSRNKELRLSIIAAGTLVSEYGDGTQPAPFRFPERNRIVAGLVAGVVVVEGAVGSGALITARRALDANRTVYAVPGSLRNPMAQGPNTLIARGEAQLVTTFKDICDDLASSFVWGSPSGGAADIEPDELEVLLALDDVPASPDVLLRSASLSGGRMAMALSKLEVRGWATRDMGGYALSGTGARVRAALLDQEID